MAQSYVWSPDMCAAPRYEILQPWMSFSWGVDFYHVHKLQGKSKGSFGGFIRQKIFQTAPVAQSYVWSPDMCAAPRYE